MQRPFKRPYVPVDAQAWSTYFGCQLRFDSRTGFYLIRLKPNVYFAHTQEDAICVAHALEILHHPQFIQLRADIAADHSAQGWFSTDASDADGLLDIELDDPSTGERIC